MSKVSVLPLLVATALASLIVALPVRAQQMPRLEVPGQEQPQDTQEEDKSLETLKIKVNVVQLFFNVKDKKGALLPNLTKDDFEVYEDGKPQTIKYFSAESNLPLTLGILIDASGSQTRVLGIEKEVGSSFLSQILREKDLAFVLSFDVNVDLLQDFTSSSRRLKEALNSVKINTAGGGGTGIPGLGGGPIPTSSTPRGTLLYDAIYLASHDELAQQVGRKAMIILTDGQDQGSQLKLRDAVEAAQKSDSIVYVLLCADRAAYGFGGYYGSGEMKKLAQETGGRVIDVGADERKFREAFDEISRELRSQYSVGFTPTNGVQDGTFRKVEIRAKNGEKIQARTGYYAVARKD